MVKYIGLNNGSVGKVKIKKGKLIDGEPDDFKKAIKIKLVREATKAEITKANTQNSLGIKKA